MLNRYNLSIIRRSYIFPQLASHQKLLDYLKLYMFVVEEDENGWTKVKKEDGAKGLVPTSYLGIQE